MSTSSGPTKLLQANCAMANTPPDTSTAGHTPANPRHPLIVTTSHIGMINDTNGSCRPAIALSADRGQSRDGREREDRRADRAERNRGSVGDERQSGGVERRESQAHQERRADRDRRPEPGRALDERAERERNQQRLDAPIGRQVRHRRLDDAELAGFDRQVVQEDRVDDDPADWQQPVRRAVDRRRRGGRRRHAVDHHRDRERRHEPGQRGPMRFPLEDAERHEQQHDRQRRGRGTEPGVAERIVDLNPGHGRLSGTRCSVRL